MTTTRTLKAPELSRRGLLAGMGGMTFCLALNNDGVRLLTDALRECLKTRSRA